MAERHDTAPRAPGGDASLLTYSAKITSLPIETVLEEVRQCKNSATTAVANLSGSPEHKAYRRRLVEGGLVSIVLVLLKRCEEESLADVIGEQVEGEYIASPGVWTSLLANAILPGDGSFSSNCSYCMEIAEGIEPLIKCMRDDKTRELYKSKEHWAVSSPFSMACLLNVMMNNPNALDVLLQHEGFLEMTVQILFWEGHRPDIMGDECIQKFLLPRLEMVKHAAMRILYLMFAKICKQVGPGQQTGRKVNHMTAEEKKKLYGIGTVPIVSEEYDPNCTVPFVVGLIELVKNATEMEDKQIWYFMLGELAVSECVDESVIKGVLELHTSDGVAADQLPKVIYRMLHVSIPGGSQPQFQPVDTRYAVAINAGLFDWCFWQMAPHGDTPHGPKVCDLVACILQGATSVAFHPKTSAAIANVRSNVRTLMHMPLPAPNAEFRMKCQKNLQMLAFFARDLGLSNPSANEATGLPTCRNCSKVLEQDAVKRCSRCKKATYCSRDCQVSAWKSGHKLECKNAIELKKSVSNMSSKDQGKVEAQAESVRAAAGEMFMDHAGSFLRWCVVNNVDALDCVVVMDLRAAPPSVDYKKAPDFLRNNLCAMRPGQRLHKTAKVDIAKNRAEGSVTGISIFPPASGNGSMAALIMDFSGSRLRCASWEAAQKAMKERMVQEGWSDGLPYPIDGFTN